MELSCWHLTGPPYRFIWFILGPTGVAKIQILPEYQVTTIQSPSPGKNQETAIDWTADAERSGMAISEHLYVYEVSARQFNDLLGDYDVRAPAQQLLTEIYERGHKWPLGERA